MSENNPSSTEPSLEDKLHVLLDTVTRRRSTYPKHLKNKNKIMAKLQLELTRRQVTAPIKESVVVMEKPPNVKIPTVTFDPDRLEKLILEYEGLRKVANQMKEDKIHHLIREEISSESILTKVRLRRAQEGKLEST